MSNFSTVADMIVDLGANPQSLHSYVFVALAGTAMISGYFVNMKGYQEGAAFTGTVGNTPKTFFNLTGIVPTVPQYGFIGRITGSNISFGLSGQLDGTYTYAPDANYPVMAISDYVIMGRVG